MGSQDRRRPRIGYVLGTQLRDLYCNVVVASTLMPRHLRWLALRAGGYRVEYSAIDARGFYRGRSVSIGRGTYINVQVMLEASAPIRIGRYCSIGPRAMLCTATHDIGGPEQRAGRDVPEPIEIGDGVWIGAAAVVLPGVTIGDGCVIAAGALVTGDCPPHGLYAGVPARRIRDLDEAEEATAGRDRGVAAAASVEHREHPSS
jgi:maltose O-acetyltransferase